MTETLQDQLRDFCSLLVESIGNKKEDEAEQSAIATNELIEMDEERSWVDNLAYLVVSVPPAPPKVDIDSARHGTNNFRQMIVDTLKRWAGESEIESNELIRKMFRLLLRQYTGVKELMDAMAQTYVLHERNVADVEIFIIYLMQIRELLHVEFENYEESLLKKALWALMNNRIFFQHPDLMRLLRVHEDVMTIMMNVLTTQQSAAENEVGDETIASVRDASEMVVACSRYFLLF